MLISQDTFCLSVAGGNNRGEPGAEGVGVAGLDEDAPGAFEAADDALSGFQAGHPAAGAFLHVVVHVVLPGDEVAVVDDDLFAGGEVNGVHGPVAGDEEGAVPVGVEQEEPGSREEPFSEILGFGIELHGGGGGQEAALLDDEAVAAVKVNAFDGPRHRMAQENFAVAPGGGEVLEEEALAGDEAADEAA